MTGGLAGSGFVAGYMEKLSTRRSVPGGGPSRYTEALLGALSNINLPSSRFHSVQLASTLHQP